MGQSRLRISTGISSKANELSPAILDGAQQIVMPAFVTFLCLCIVFFADVRIGWCSQAHPFRPLAEACRLCAPSPPSSCRAPSFPPWRTTCFAVRICMLQAVEMSTGRDLSQRRLDRETFSCSFSGHSNFDLRKLARAIAGSCHSLSAIPKPSLPASSGASYCRSDWGRFSARTSFRPSILARS